MNWLPDMDLNHDKQIQSLLCYRYTIGQTSLFMLEFPPVESRTVSAACPKAGFPGEARPQTVGQASGLPVARASGPGRSVTCLQRVWKFKDSRYLRTP